MRFYPCEIKKNNKEKRNQTNKMRKEEVIKKAREKLKKKKIEIWSETSEGKNLI